MKHQNVYAGTRPMLGFLSVTVRANGHRSKLRAAKNKREAKRLEELGNNDSEAIVLYEHPPEPDESPNLSTDVTPVL